MTVSENTDAYASPTPVRRTRRSRRPRAAATTTTAASLRKARKNIDALQLSDSDSQSDAAEGETGAAADATRSEVTRQTRGATRKRSVRCRVFNFYMYIP